MNIKKISLSDRETPIVIENSFPKLGFNSLLLGSLENKHKLRPLLHLETDTKSTVTDLERNVLEALEKSTQSLEKSTQSENEEDDTESQDDKPDIEEQPTEEKEVIPEGTEKDAEPPLNPEEDDYEDDDEEKDETLIQTQLQEERSDIFWSLKKLRRYYDTKHFPHYDDFTSTAELKRILKEVKREAILDENVNQTRQYITMVWFALEKVCTEYLSIDLSGFTAYETQHMNEYHKVLVEIGERSYLNWSEGFPPELKLVYLMLTHAALFHVKKNTTNFVDFINILDSNKSGEMRGPSKIF